ncbi:DUF6580 family putative transport protein [Pseudobacter ginsenosidimutans]|uniref:Uncharacterized protein n=1 Tax=Pseudobacter ginsenosidimutans TaxID=661488 RepID=A0A4Q7MTW2_9BACT|nr:DUF6580 family putative transport protein [Pseudobacter ginsenosidimutans]QEC40944.1 hypothetical protein FSB84_04255 [Pseudobacter ginsenosidimutans]RZS72316.1 hypothetical protein EV199_4235 [Pseudobacter ginsenosidimutans]
MSLKQFNPRNTVLFAFMVVVALMRIFLSAEAPMNPIATFTPLGAMALFGGTYFNNRAKSVLFPVLTLWMSDIILNRFVYYNEWRFFYEGFYWTYISYALMAVAAKFIIRKVTVSNIIIASLAGTLIHWIGTSPGCFMIENSMYPKTWAGYFTSLVAAIPYERNFLIGTLVYSGVLFGGFELLQRRYSALRPAH